MSTAPTGEASTTDEPLANVLFDYPGADIVLRSQDSYHFRVPKIYIINSSPVLGELIRRALGSSRTVAKADFSLPVVQLPESSEILHCLLTFVFPLNPLVPSTSEEVMKPLSTAQEYQMGAVLVHIRGRIARENLLPTRFEPALHIYALAQRYELLPEALQAARAISNYSMSIDDFDDMLDIMPGASLYELWKYHERVRAILASDLAEFRSSGAHGTVTNLPCDEYSPSHIPNWVDQYIESVEEAPNLFDLVDFYAAMELHVRDPHGNESGYCECGDMIHLESQTIRKFWAALESVVHGSFKKAESALVLVGERAQDKSISPPLEPFDVPDANLIIRSSDHIDFRVHKPVLAVSSPLFRALLSLPQPYDGETVDGLPMVQFSEDSELLNNLFSMLYPISSMIPNSYEKVLYLLAGCQKYEMDSVQLSIRGKVNCGEFPAPKGTEAFAAYAIASSKGLIPEMENAARQTLDHPMTFNNCQVLGEGLQLFEGWALRDLASFRRRCRDNLIACLDSFLEVKPSRPSNIWASCSYDSRSSESEPAVRVLPSWLRKLLSRCRDDLELQVYTHPLDIHSRIRDEYVKALRAHLNCKSCAAVHVKKGFAYCAKLEKKLEQARNKVRGDSDSHTFEHNLSKS